LRIEAHILVCFLAYCLSVTLRKRCKCMRRASGAVLETLSGILMLDVRVPLADGRELLMPRYTQPEAEHRLVLVKLGWDLPPQPPPRTNTGILSHLREVCEQTHTSRDHLKGI
jgi:hypothetical protein